METQTDNCLCSSENRIVMACSGASDVGHLSDLAARKLRDNNIFKMNCLAVVGAGIEKSIENFKTKELLIIDGCPVDCGKKIMVRNGIKQYKYLRLSDIGFEKGKSEANPQNIQKVYEKAESLIQHV